MCHICAGMCACACVGCVVVGLRYVRRRQTWKVEENGVLLHVFSVSFCISVILSLAYRHECVPSRDKGGYARTQRRVREEKKDLEQKRPPVSQNVAYRARVSCSSFVLVYSPRIRCSKQSQIIEGMTKYKEGPGARPSFLAWLTPYLTFLAIPFPHAGIKTRRKGKPAISTPHASHVGC